MPEMRAFLPSLLSLLWSATALAGTGATVATDNVKARLISENASIAPGSTDTEIFDQLRERAATAGVTLPPPLAPADVATAVRFMVERPAHANVARLLLVSSAESA